MIQKRRTRVDWDDLIDTIEHDPRFAVSSLTLDVVRVAPPDLEMHDGIIVATAVMFRDVLGEEVNLITRDKDIRDSGLVETVW